MDHLVAKVVLLGDSGYATISLEAPLCFKFSVIFFIILIAPPQIICLFIVYLFIYLFISPLWLVLEHQYFYLFIISHFLSFIH
jgi:hypothetical protein